eukprot:15481601-Alexandrium_andersonii.AAC.1
MEAPRRGPGVPSWSWVATGSLRGRFLGDSRLRRRGWAPGSLGLASLPAPLALLAIALAGQHRAIDDL